MAGPIHDTREGSLEPPIARKRLRGLDGSGEAIPAGRTRGKPALFATCYWDHSDPVVVEDLAAVLQHNAIPIRLVEGRVASNRRADTARRSSTIHRRRVEKPAGSARPTTVVIPAKAGMTTT